MPRRSKAQKEAHQLEVMRLTLAGGTTRSIAAQIGISHETIRKDRDEVLERTAREQVDAIAQYRTLMNARYERLWLQWWPKALDGTLEDGTRQEGSPEAFDKLMRLGEAIRKLNGLDEWR